MLKIRILQIYLFFLLILLSSCNTTPKETLVYTPMKIGILRFDQDFMNLKQEQAAAQDSLWSQHYGAFYKDFVPNMLRIRGDSLRRLQQLKEVAVSPDFNALSRAVAQTFPDLSAEEAALGDALGRLNAYFPDKQLPAYFIAFFSGFSVQIPVGEAYIGIGLDLFLGTDAPFYPALQTQIPRYISRRFTRENMVPKVVEGLLKEHWFEEKSLEGTFLDHILKQGKMMQLMKHALPKVPDSVLIGYTEAQMRWAETYEREVWNWFVHQELLYSTDYMSFQKHLNEAPFTPELGENNESAPKLGVFIGWKIIQHYQKHHPDLSLSALMEHKNAQSLLKASRYKGEAY